MQLRWLETSYPLLSIEEVILLSYAEASEYFRKVGSQTKVLQYWDAESFDGETARYGLWIDVPVVTQLGE